MFVRAARLVFGLNDYGGYMARITIQLAVNGLWGINTPKRFFERYPQFLTHLNEEDHDIISNPEHEHYWEVWNHLFRISESSKMATVGQFMRTETYSSSLSIMSLTTRRVYEHLRHTTQQPLRLHYPRSFCRGSSIVGLSRIGKSNRAI